MALRTDRPGSRADLGMNTADAVARHLCAKHGITDGPIVPSKTRALQHTVRRGLVAFVGPERAAELASLCFRETAAPDPGGARPPRASATGSRTSCSLPGAACSPGAGSRSR